MRRRVASNGSAAAAAADGAASTARTGGKALASRQGDAGRSDAPLFLAAAGLLALVVAISYASLFAGPPPLPASAPAHAFSEARAMLHVTALAGGDGNGGGDGVTGSGGRQVGTPGAAAAARYLASQGAALAAAAAAAGGHYAVETHVQHVTGAVDMRFLGVDFGNAWYAIPNVAIKITPSQKNASTATRAGAAAGGMPALLLAAHYDSTVGSPGAADAAACVAVALEAARALVSRPPPPPAAASRPQPTTTLAARRRAATAAAAAAAPYGPASPIILLFNGAEEALMQGAFGFTASSPWAADVGAFINLEATGADGPASLFQASGSWATAAYAAGAPRPHGTVIAQAFFDAGITPADTDFRAFAARGDGALAGVDAALILGAEVYHTHADAPGRLRRGTMQAFGEQATGGAAGLSAALAAGWSMVAEAGPAGKGGGPPTTGHHRALGTNSGAATRARGRGAQALEQALGPPGDLGVYFDWQGKFLVTYPPDKMALVHAAPLGLVVALLALVPASRGGAGPGALLAAAARAGAGVVGGVAVPGLAGAALAALTGRPLAWFLAPGLLGLPAYAAFSVAGSLAPHAFFVRGGRGGGGNNAARVATAGFALTHAAAAAAGAWAAAPAAYLPALWAVTATAAIALPALTPVPDAAAAAGAWCVAASTTAPNALALGLHMLQKASFAGSPVIGAGPAAAAAVGDGLVAAAVGGCAAAVTGFGAGWVGRRARRAAGARALVVGAALAAAALLLATALAAGAAPYTPLAPKKLYLQRLHRLNGTGGGVSSEWAVAGVDATPLARALGRPPPPSSSPTPPLPPGPASPWAPAPGAGRGLDWLVLYPLGYVLETATARSGPGGPATAAGGEGPGPGPAMAVVEEAATGRLHLTLTLPPSAPPGVFGALNISGPALAAWSFTARNFTAHPTDRAGGPGGPEAVGWHLVRLAGTPPDRKVAFWVDVGAPRPRPPLRLGVALASVGAGGGGDAIIAGLPPWTSVAAATTWVGEWVVP